MTFTFAPARRENVGLLIGLAGASGSGKTYSALSLAKGISPSGKIAFIDTEARRGLHYADQFSFDHADMKPPFRPDRFVEGIRAAESAGAEVVIIDSFSHEYDGEGGIMDWADELAANGVKSPGNWKDPKAAHKKLMNKLLQCRATVIFCLRADEKISIDRVEYEDNGRKRTKTVVTPLGWVPICEKRFMYEMTASFTLSPSAPGIPQFDLPHKLQSQHRGFFPQGKTIDEQAGRALADWARGGTVQSSNEPASSDQRTYVPDEVAEAAQGAALSGTKAYQQYFTALSPAMKKALVDTGAHEANKSAAAIIDAKEGLLS